MFRRSPVSSFQCFRPWSTSLLCSYHIPTVMLSTCCLLAKLCLTLWPHWLYWSWSSNTLVPWCKELTHWERPWCWERLKAGGEGGDRGWDGWMASLTQWTWVWASSGRWWRTGKCAAVHGVTESKTSKQLKKTVAGQAPLSMGFPRWEDWGGIPFPSPGDLPHSGVEPASPTWQADSLPLSHQGSPHAKHLNIVSFYTYNHSLR